LNCGRIIFTAESFFRAFLLRGPIRISVTWHSAAIVVTSVYFSRLVSYLSYTDFCKSMTQYKKTVHPTVTAAAPLRPVLSSGITYCLHAIWNRVSQGLEGFFHSRHLPSCRQCQGNADVPNHGLFSALYVVPANTPLARKHAFLPFLLIPVSPLHPDNPSPVFARCSSEAADSSFKSPRNY
jgi:hypothetical protein